MFLFLGQKNLAGVVLVSCDSTWLASIVSDAKTLFDMQFILPSSELCFPSLKGLFIYLFLVDKIVCRLRHQVTLMVETSKLVDRVRF